MLGLLARTVYFLQLSNEKFERQIIINSDRWKAKIFNFALPILLRKNQEIKETVPNPAFAVKILAVNPNKERARN